MPEAVRTLETLVSRATSAVQRGDADAATDESTAPAGDAPGGTGSAEAAGTTSDDAQPESRPPLYGCTNCDRTYVGGSMSTCSNCGSEVEEVPDEQELGLL